MLRFENLIELDCSRSGKTRIGMKRAGNHSRRRSLRQPARRCRFDLAAPMLAIALVATSCRPIPPPILKPFADNRDWVLVQDVVYQVGTTPTTINVPKGFVTDFASIPESLWSFGLSPNGKYSKAAIIHDYLYWTQLCTRLQADNILMIAMKESQVSKVTRTLIYDGVRLGGSQAWSDNAKEKHQGLPKIIPAAKLDFGPAMLWKDYRATLKAAGVTDPAPAAQTYCAVGDTTDVPSTSR